MTLRIICGRYAHKENALLFHLSNNVRTYDKRLDTDRALLLRFPHFHVLNQFFIFGLKSIGLGI